MNQWNPTHSYATHTHDKPVVLAIAGSDSAGLAGVQMDSRCYHAMGVHGATVITAVTAQNNERLFSLNPVSKDTFREQITAALALNPHAIKIGLLGSPEQVAILCELLPDLDIPIVYDPVINTSSDGQCVDSDFLNTIRRDLLPLCTVITPNLPETNALLTPSSDSGEKTAPNNSPFTQMNIPQAAKTLASLGPQWVVIKGGHSDTDTAEDYCYGPDRHCDSEPGFYLSHPKVQTPHLRGTGCAFSSTLASCLARGYEIRDALIVAKMAIQQGIIDATSVNQQRGCVDIKAFPKKQWPHYFDQAILPQDQTLDFPSCTGGSEPEHLGLYPIVDSAQWLARLLPHGITTAQLRVKHLTGEDLAAEIEQAIAIGKHYRCRLFINDHWQLAIEKGAYGVHLGQEDIETADLYAIQKAGLRLGLSNHCHFEVARALAVKPSYIACGPTFATTTKDMPWVPHGLEGLNYWAQALPDYPLVSIAGINDHNIEDVTRTGVSGIAMITALTLADNPEEKTQTLVRLIQSIQSTTE